MPIERQLAEVGRRLSESSQLLMKLLWEQLVVIEIVIGNQEYQASLSYQPLVDVLIGWVHIVDSRWIYRFAISSQQWVMMLCDSLALVDVHKGAARQALRIAPGLVIH